MAWYAYHIGPIDFNWDCMKTVFDTAQALGGVEAELVARGEDLLMYDGPLGTDFLRYWREAKDAAAEVGWEGDFRGDPVVFWIPAESEFRYGFAFKQDNNGSTFVISPVKLPWLDSLI